MSVKKIYAAVILIIFCIGVYAGNSLYKYYTHCLQINYKKNMFYGQFAVELKKAMQKLGYNLSCPIGVPQTIIDFTYTGNNVVHQVSEHKKRNTYIALVGDCFDAFDINFLKTYDYLLAVDEMRFGYIAMFNFRAVHFPIKDRPKGKLCNTSYDMNKIDIEDVALQLDNVIQRIR